MFAIELRTVFIEQGIVMRLWEWISSLQSGAATFVAVTTGAGIVLIALLLAVLYNARQKRFRDDRLRMQEARALAVALKSELKHIAKGLREHINDLRDPSPRERGYMIADLRRSVRILPQSVHKLGLLDTDTLEALFGAYSLIDELRSRVIAIIGPTLVKEMEEKGEIAALPSSSMPQIVSASDRVIKIIDVALSYLDKYDGK
jgi:hypothetical protein